MKIDMETRGEALVARLMGELDHHTAPLVRSRLDAAIAGDPSISRVVLDCSELSFMDSSGIGVILGRHNAMKRRGGKLTVMNVPSQMDRVIEAAGLYQIIDKEGASRRRGR